MAKVNRPLGLIAYDNDVNIARRAEGLEERYPIVRPRTVLYAALIALVGAVMLWGLLNRTFTDISVLHDRNPLFTRLSDGSTRNAYTVRVVNKRPQARLFSLAVDGILLARASAVGSALTVGEWPVIDVGPDATREVIVHVTVPANGTSEASTRVTFRLVELGTGETVSARDHFISR